MSADWHQWKLGGEIEVPKKQNKNLNCLDYGGVHGFISTSSQIEKITKTQLKIIIKPENPNTELLFIANLCLNQKGIKIEH